MTFKFEIGDVVNVVSKDRNLSGMTVRIASRETDDTVNWYLVDGVGIHVRLSFFEDQLA